MDASRPALSKIDGSTGLVTTPLVGDVVDARLVQRMVATVVVQLRLLDDQQIFRRILNQHKHALVRLPVKQRWWFVIALHGACQKDGRKKTRRRKEKKMAEQA